MPLNMGVWRTAHANRAMKNVTVDEQNSEGVHIKVQYELTSISVPYIIEYQIQNEGSVAVTTSLDMTGKELPDLPRFGMRLRLPAPYKNISYYGRGHWENYSDRNEAAFVGLYKDDVANQYYEGYIRPQESGYKTDDRWVSLTNDNGSGLRIEGVQPICFSATNHAVEDLDPGLSKKQQHPTDLRPDRNVYLHIDLKQRGVGGDDSWGALPHDQYSLLDKKYSFSYVIRLVDNETSTVSN
jgi:beta-galactosidase